MTAVRSSFEALLMEVFLLGRGVLFRGSRYRCPVCSTSIRAFTRGGGSLRVRDRGYCPRCNAKARHRRVWLHLELETELFERPHRLLHVSPKYCLMRRLARLEGIHYTAIDLETRLPHVAHGDVTELEHEDESFDAIVCVHVLEHVEDDRSAIGEMWRVLRPGGWAVVNVPVDLEARTYEDLSVTSPDARRRAFGEADHVRIYGFDISDRLRAAGFEVRLFRADRLPTDLLRRHGLTADEHVYHCVKALESA